MAIDQRNSPESGDWFQHHTSDPFGKMLALSPLMMCTVTRLRASRSLDKKQHMCFLSLACRQCAQDRVLCAELSQCHPDRRNEIMLYCSMSLCQSAYKEQVWLAWAVLKWGKSFTASSHEFKQKEGCNKITLCHPEVCIFCFTPWEYLWELFTFNYTLICRSKPVEFRQLEVSFEAGSFHRCCLGLSNIKDKNEVPSGAIHVQMLLW